MQVEQKAKLLPILSPCHPQLQSTLWTVCDLPEGSVHVCTDTMEAAGAGGAGTLQLQGPGETLSCYSLCGSGSDDGLCASVSSSIK